MLFPVCESKNKLETMSRIPLILVTAAWTLHILFLFFFKYVITVLDLDIVF